MRSLPDPESAAWDMVVPHGIPPELGDAYVEFVEALLADDPPDDRREHLETVLADEEKPDDDAVGSGDA